MAKRLKTEFVFIREESEADVKEEYTEDEDPLKVDYSETPGES